MQIPNQILPEASNDLFDGPWTSSRQMAPKSEARLLLEAASDVQSAIEVNYVSPPEPNLEDISEEEEEEFQLCHTWILNAQRAVLEAGFALERVQSKRLYRSRFKTFDAYIDYIRRWKRSYVYALIEYAAMVREMKLSAIADDSLILPANESQARELSVIPGTENRVTVLKRASEIGKGKVTAALIKKARARFFSENPALTPEKPAPEEPKGNAGLEPFGVTLRLQPATITALKRKASRERTSVEALLSSVVEAHFQRTRTEVEENEPVLDMGDLFAGM